jgi:hypothetical protein
MKQHLIALMFCLSSSVFAQASTLSLDYEDVYLSDVSRKLTPDGYQQFLTTTLSDASGIIQTDTWKSVVLGNDRFSEVATTYFTSSSYLIAGVAYSVSVIGAERPSCTKLEPGQYMAQQAMNVISDTTGFLTATLLSADETVNGIQADRYKLEPPSQNSYFDPSSLRGELWLNREGGFIVKYLAEGTSSDGTITRWHYELSPAEPIPPPIACAGL